MSEHPPTGLAVYIHWPFCRAKCPYCDFNSHVRHGGVDAPGFAASLARELQSLAELAGPRRVASVFFGGGTPSLMPPGAVETVLAAVDRCWGLPEDAEVTLEANPTSVEAGNFRAYRSSGVNRLSVGVQSLRDEALLRLGRQHSAAEALAAFRLAASVFPRVSLDLIYARPGQTVTEWRMELAEAIAEEQGHMSLYQLTIEPGTPFAELHAKGLLVPPGEAEAAELYEVTQELTAAAGLHAYEVSNHARPGHESRHNLAYWRYGEYAGAGPGAHSRLVDSAGRRMAVVNEPHPETWRSLVAERGHGRRDMTTLDPADEANELLLMGLRLSEGIALDRYERLTGRPIPSRLLDDLSGDGLLSVDPMRTRLRATARGRRLLNALTAALATAD
jgi:oxygen-independent coproporphyrinogen-3 oxidase